MERELWPELYRFIRDAAKIVHQKYVSYQPDIVAAVYFWAVLSDRHPSWACRQSNWAGIADRPRKLPSASTLSRRLARVGIGVFFRTIVEQIRRDGSPALIAAVDGKPLPVGGNSKDPDAKFGHAAGGTAKGYKFHAIWSDDLLPDAWDVMPMNRCEMATAMELLEQIPPQPGGYLLGDGNYDASKVYDAAAARGRQLLTPLPKGTPSKGHYQSPHRLAGLELMKTAKGRGLYRQRTAIERQFGHLTGFAGGLSPLPAWVRGRRRVRTWVWAKLIINAVRIILKE